MPIHSSLSLVIDTNIWIYLSRCGLVDAAFRLGSLHVPDLMRTKEVITELSWQDLENRDFVPTRGHLIWQFSGLPESNSRRVLTLGTYDDTL
jgi:hypothetical protein